jgi:hypothetical protein
MILNLIHPERGARSDNSETSLIELAPECRQWRHRIHGYYLRDM